MANPFLISMKNIMQAELWEFPNLTSGAEFDFEKKSLKIDERIISTPVFVTIDDKDVKDIRFFIPGSPEKEKFLATGIIEKEDFLWVDSCTLINQYVLEGDSISSGNDTKQLCSVSKLAGSIKKNVLDQSINLLPPLD